MPEDSFSLDDIKYKHVYANGTARSFLTDFLGYSHDILLDTSNQKNHPSSVILIDTSGDAGLKMAMIQHNMKQLTVIDPTYVDFVFNPLELPKEDTKEESTLVQTRIGEMLSIMKELFGANPQQAPRLVWILRGALYFLYTITNAPTFTDLYFLILDLVGVDTYSKFVLMNRELSEKEIVNKTMEALVNIDDTTCNSVMTKIQSLILPESPMHSKIFRGRNTTLDFMR